ncbi:hypothetical protein [Kitasatospora albolonga]|uniref:hypothetical protein n=1 Tax=Kitasatospora albolonga TaxID=68173 RepID=UPI0031EE52D3
MEEGWPWTGPGWKYGGITVVGLPPEWPLLVDEAWWWRSTQVNDPASGGGAAR